MTKVQPFEVLAESLAIDALMAESILDVYGVPRYDDNSPTPYKLYQRVEWLARLAGLEQQQP